MREGRTTLPEPFRTQVANLLLKMDCRHSLLIESAMVAVVEGEAATRWINGKTTGWPTLTPLCERTLSAVLQLQADMLRLTLKHRNPTLFEALDEGLHKRCVRSPEERFFKDMRDQFVCEVLDSLTTIARLQGALGAAGKIDLGFPAAAETKEAFYADLLEKIKIVTQRATNIRPPESTGTGNQ
jgi:hypothetical protein